MPMKRRPTSEQLIREYVSAVLKENDENPAFYGQSAGGMIDIGSAGDILDLLGVRGVINLGKTVMGKTKELTTRLKSSLNVMKGVIISSFCPFAGYDYSDVFDKEEADLKKVRQEYKDVYDATDAVFKDNDMAMFAFMANPGIFLGSKIASAAPEAARTMLSSATGGKSDEILNDVIEDLKDSDRWLAGEDDKERASRLKRKKERRKSRSKGKDTSSPLSLFGGMSDGRTPRGARLTEEEEKEKEKLSLADLLRNKDLISKIIDSSEELQNAMKQSTVLYRKTLQAAVTEAKKALDALTYESIIKNTKKKTPEFIEQVKAIAAMPPADQKTAKQQVVLLAKNELKKNFLEKLTKRVDNAVKAGANENSQLVQDHAAAIKKIQAM